jgi:sugar lactone lactonase YvrE
LDLLLDARAELAEGPIWDAASAQLIWVDQLAGTINRAGLDGTAAAAVVLEGRVGCALPRDDGGLVLACGAGFARLGCVFAGPALDVLVITSAWHRLDPTQRSAEPHAGGIFCCRPGVSGLPGHRFAADG